MAEDIKRICLFSKQIMNETAVLNFRINNSTKMKTSVSILIVLALLMVGSCNEGNIYQHATSINRNDFKTTQSLIGSVVQFDNEVLKPTHLQVFDSLLFTINTREERTIHIFDLKAKRKIGERITAGNGPGEMLQPRIVKVDKESIQIFDIATSTLFEYSMSDFVANPKPIVLRKIKLDKSTASEAYLLGEHLIGAVYNPSYQLNSYNLNGKKVGEYGSYPNSDVVFSDSEKLESYRFSFITNLNDKMLICYNWTDLIDILDKDGHLEKRLHGPEHFISLFKEFHEGDVISANSMKGQTRDAYFSPVSVGNDFFVLYSGKSEDEEGYSILANQIFVFSWKGVPEQILSLDQGVFSITVDEKNKKIYGISDTPEFHIVEFAYK